MNVLHIKSTEGSCFIPAEVEDAGLHLDSLTLTGAKGQYIKGFGGCFNEMGWEVLQQLTPEDRKAVLDQFFLPENCNFSYGRVPIGANDFSLEWYSCDEVKNDLELTHFNIERDKEYTIPFIREAAARQKDFSLFASPWSPPTWMKTKPVYNFGTMRMEPKVLTAYANYFVKFVKAYQAEGLHVSQVHVQNEPMADQKFPSCKWNGQDMLVFIRDYLGPILTEKSPETQLWLGTINGPFLDILMGTQSFSEFFDQFANTILSDPKAYSHISGVGLQWGGKHLLSQLQTSYPELPILQTESECGDGKNSWEFMEYVFGLMWQYFQHGAEGYTYWNLALAENEASTWGWAQNSLLTLNRSTGVWTFQPEFYLMKHFSQFVRPGAVLLKTKGRFSATSLAFSNPDGSTALVVHNGLSRSRAFCFQSADISFSAQLEPHSLHTFLIH